MQFPTSPCSFYETEEGTTHYKYIENEGAQTIIVVPGFSLPLSVYFPFCEKLAETGYSVLVMDYYGRGYSELKEKNNQNIKYCPHFYAQQLIALIKKLEIDKCDMVAFSFGALVASHITSLEPDLISKLVLVSPFKFLKKPARPFQKSILTHPTIGPWVLSTFSAQFVPTELMNQINAEENSELFWSLVSATMKEVNQNKSYFKATSQMLSILDENSIDSDLIMLRQIPFKTLVLFGEKDSTVNVQKSSSWWSTTLLNGKVVTIPNAGHLCFLEETDIVLDNITKFLNK